MSRSGTAPRRYKRATAQDFFQQSAQRSVQEFAVAAYHAVYRVVIEATAD